MARCDRNHRAARTGPRRGRSLRRGAVTFRGHEPFGERSIALGEGFLSPSPAVSCGRSTQECSRLGLPPPAQDISRWARSATHHRFSQRHPDRSPPLRGRSRTTGLTSRPLLSGAGRWPGRGGSSGNTTPSMPSRLPPRGSVRSSTAFSVPSRRMTSIDDLRYRDRHNSD